MKTSKFNYRSDLTASGSCT